MQHLLDLVGAIVIGGLIMLLLIGYNANLVQTSSTMGFTLREQENLSAATEVLEFDFRKMGYRVADSIKVTLADTARITFRTDLDNNGALDSIRYYLGSVPSRASGNRQVRTLYRVVNNRTPYPVHTGIRQFRLWYLDRLGNFTTVRQNIRAVRVLVNSEGNASADGRYTGISWDRVIRPKNLR
ncbi:MAG: hypothetical protein WB626_08415 [Bacteroidota bacterium]